MTRLLPIALVLGIFFAATDASEAKGHSGSKPGSTHSGNKHDPGKGMTGKGMHGNHRSYPHGYNQWSSRYWNSRYGCEFCFSAVDGCYFYYYAPAVCFYPVTIIEQFPPIAVPAPAAVQVPVPPPTPVAQVPPPSVIAPVGPSIQVTNINR